MYTNCRLRLPVPPRIVLIARFVVFCRYEQRYDRRSGQSDRFPSPWGRLDATWWKRCRLDAGVTTPSSTFIVPPPQACLTTWTTKKGTRTRKAKRHRPRMAAGGGWWSSGRLWFTSSVSNFFFYKTYTINQDKILISTINFWCSTLWQLQVFNPKLV